MIPSDWTICAGPFASATEALDYQLVYQSTDTDYDFTIHKNRLGYQVCRRPRTALRLVK